jgi:hypothetical protein
MNDLPHIPTTIDTHRPSLADVEAQLRKLMAPGAVWDDQTGWHFPEPQATPRMNETDFPTARGLRISREALATIVREELRDILAHNIGRTFEVVVDDAERRIVQRAYAQPWHDDQHRIEGAD